MTCGEPVRAPLSPPRTKTSLEVQTVGALVCWSSQTAFCWVIVPMWEQNEKWRHFVWRVPFRFFPRERGDVKSSWGKVTLGSKLLNIWRSTGKKRRWGFTIWQTGGERRVNKALPALPSSRENDKGKIVNPQLNPCKIPIKWLECDWTNRLHSRGTKGSGCCCCFRDRRRVFSKRRAKLSWLAVEIWVDWLSWSRRQLIGQNWRKEGAWKMFSACCFPDG